MSKPSCKRKTLRAYYACTGSTYILFYVLYFTWVRVLGPECLVAECSVMHA